MFCKNCGKEVPENAYVCIGCGCLVDRKPVVQKRKDLPVVLEAEKKPIKNLLFKLFLLISFSMACLAVGVLFASIVYGHYSYQYSPYNKTMINFSLDWGSALVALIFSLVSMGFGIVVFIFGLKEKEAFKLISILNFIFTIILFISVFACTVISL